VRAADVVRAVVAILGAALALVLSIGAFSACSSETPAQSDAGFCPSDLPASCPADAPSWSKEISDVIARRCLGCHGDGGVASVTRDFTTYDKVFVQRSPILNQVYACQMPPSDAAPLTDAERADLLAWLVCRAPNN